MYAYAMNYREPRLSGPQAEQGHCDEPSLTCFQGVAVQHSKAVYLKWQSMPDAVEKWVAPTFLVVGEYEV